MFTIIFRIKAVADLEEIQLYYNNLSPSISYNFFKKFYQTLGFIEKVPTLFQERYREIRIAPFNKYPYGIHYKLKDNTIIVYRILHTKRYFKQ